MKKRVIAVLLATILLGTLLAGCGAKEEKNETSAKEEDYVPVEINTVSKDTIYNTTIFSGKVFADKDVIVVPKVPGKVSNVNVKVSERVKKGQILFSMDKEDIEKQVAQAKAALDGARANYDLTYEKIENAKISLERTKKLYEEGAISKAQYEQAELAASDKALEAAKTALSQAELAYEQATDALKNTTVESPIEGIVSSVNIEVGEMASNAQPAVTIVDMDRVYIQINVAENIINQLYKGQEVKVSIPSASDDEFTGKIDNISPTTDLRTQLYPVKIYIDNQNHTIKPGMLAQVKINTDIKNDVVVVKSESVVDKNGESLVFVVEGDRAIAKKVETGLDTGTYVEIINGINPGEKVIVKGQNYVKDNSKVKVVRGE